MRSRFAIKAATLLSLVLAVPVARADIFRDIGVGLGYAGFNIQGNHNPLSNGVDLLVNRNLVGNPLDFGLGDLTLRGPVSFDVSTSNRLIPQIEIGLSTALDRRSTAQPISYLLNFDPGSQETSIAGTLLLDADLSINQMGFYNFDLIYSSRQDVARSGRFENDLQEFDNDLGPISMRGNLVFDGLALVTEPLFRALGTFNVFTSLSGPGSISDLLTGSPESILSEFADGSDAVSAEQSRLLAAAPVVEFLDVSANKPHVTRATVQSAPPSSVVPEPAVIVLLLLGLPVLARSPRRWRFGPGVPGLR